MRNIVPSESRKFSRIQIANNKVKPSIYYMESWKTYLWNFPENYRNSIFVFCQGNRDIPGLVYPIPQLFTGFEVGYIFCG